MSNKNNRLANAKLWFIKTALSYLGTPYIWGGDDPSGFDCSGFVVECLKSVGLISERHDYTANGLYRLFNSERYDSGSEHSSPVIDRVGINSAKTATVKKSDVDIATDKMTGMLMFRFAKSGRATHVVICLDRWFQIGASGGGRTTVLPENSWDENAYVKIRPIGEKGVNIRFVDPFVNMKE